MSRRTVGKHKRSKNPLALETALGVGLVAGIIGWSAYALANKVLDGHEGYGKENPRTPNLNTAPLSAEQVATFNTRMGE